MPLETARAIGKLGFARWYERQLIEGHAWLVTCLLCSIGIAASVEVLNFREAASALLTLTFVFVAGLICLHGFRRYRALMELAEQIASRSTCPACATYARFKVLDPNARMRVCCRRCGNEWVID